MNFILGKKLKMSQIWQNDKIVPVTVIQAGPVTVTQVKNKDKDGYDSAQVGFDATKKKINKPEKGHLKDLGNFKNLKEFRLKTNNPMPTGRQEQSTTYNVGDVLTVEQFNEGDKVKVSGLDNGRGYQGVVKRHGFGGGPKTHGQKNRYRAPGSIGATAPQRVMPGRKMAGHMGTERVSVKNLKVVAIDKENNILMVKGAVPGMKGVILEICK